MLKTSKDVSAEKDLIRDAFQRRKGKTPLIASMKIHGLKINRLPASPAPAQLLVILLGVNVNVFMLLYGCWAWL